MAFGGRRGIDWRIARGITEPRVEYYYTRSNQKVSRLIVLLVNWFEYERARATVIELYMPGKRI